MSSGPSGDTPLEQLLGVFDRLPFVSNVKKDVAALRSLLYLRRPPRLACVGDIRGGRSAVAEALFGEAGLPLDGSHRGSWVGLSARGARVDWLELDPESAAPPDKDVLASAQPDVLLVVVPPGELGAQLSQRLKRIHTLASVLAKAGEGEVKIVGVLSDAHVVPVEGTLNGSAAVELVRERLENAMKEADLEVSAVVALGSEEPPDREAGLQRLSGALFDALPDAARMEAARALIHAPGPRREVANRIVKICSTIALTVGLAPIPLSDAVVIAPLQVVMVSAIAHLGGRPWDRKAAAEWIGSMGLVGGAGLGFRWTAQQLAKLIPGAGSFVSASVAGAGTVALGQSAVAYFLRERPRELVSGNGDRRAADVDDVILEDDEDPGADAVD